MAMLGQTKPYRRLGFRVSFLLVALSAIAGVTNEQLAEAQQLMADKAFNKSGDMLVQVLIGRGLSEVDATAAVWQMLIRQAECTTQALKTQSDLQGISFELMLRKFSTGLGVEGLEKTRHFDFRAFSERAKPCMDAAMVDAGVTTTRAQ